MKRLILFWMVPMATLGLLAADGPFVESCSSEQSDATGEVTVTYSLSAPAVVTLTVETNRGDGVWLAVDPHVLTNATGDVNRRIEDSYEHVIRWSPTLIKSKTLRGGLVRTGIRAWAPTETPDFMVVDLKNDNTVRYYPSEDALPFAGGVTDRLCKTDFLLMKKVHAAGCEFRMGAISIRAFDIRLNRWQDTAVGTADADKPQHLVGFTNDYYLAVYELTQAQYTNIMRKCATAVNPSKYTGDDAAVHPVEGFKIVDVRGAPDSYYWPDDGHKVISSGNQAFIHHLRANSGIATFDFPTEARWEYACKAGTCTQLYNGRGLTATGATACTNLNELAWYYRNPNCGGTTHEVGTLPPNPWGFYDMLGNVYEKCLDHYIDGETYSDGSPVIEPTGPRRGTTSDSWHYKVVIRGGSYTHQAESCRPEGRASCDHHSVFTNHGFRMCCEVE